jgi:hypothetical protein
MVVTIPGKRIKVIAAFEVPGKLLSGQVIVISKM